MKWPISLEPTQYTQQRAHSKRWVFSIALNEFRQSAHLIERGSPLHNTRAALLKARSPHDVATLGSDSLSPSVADLKMCAGW